MTLRHPISILAAATLAAATLGAVGVTRASAASPAKVVRAALPVGAVQHIFVIDLENEGYSATFGPGSPATYLNGTLRPEGVLIEHYYGIGTTASTTTSPRSQASPHLTTRLTAR